MRFVTTHVDENSHQAQGLFQAAYGLLRSNDLSAEEEEELRALMAWFGENLASPSGPKDTARAVFWYRASARDCVSRMWELANLVRLHGHTVELQTCRSLINIRWSDKHQVAAIPHTQDAPIHTKTVGG